MKKIILLLSLLPLYLFSQNKIHDGYLYYLNQYASYKDDKMQITMNYDVKIHWKFWTLMGEPVMIAQMIWAPTLVQKKINGIDTNLNVETNKELLEKLRVYEFIVDAKLKKSVNSAYVLSSLKTLGEVQIDTGVGTFPFTTKLVSNILDVDFNSIESQFKSYNVAGSKDWDKLLKIGNTFATKQKAIEFFKQDKILFDTSSVVSAKVDFTSLATHYANTQAQILKNKEIEKQKKVQEAELEKIKQEESKIVQQKENLNDSLESLFEEKNIEKLKALKELKDKKNNIATNMQNLNKINSSFQTYMSIISQKELKTKKYIQTRINLINSKKFEEKPKITNNKTISNTLSNGESLSSFKTYIMTNDYKNKEQQGSTLSISGNSVQVQWLWNKKTDSLAEFNIQEKIDPNHYVLKFKNKNLWHIFYTREKFLILVPDSDQISSFKTVGGYTKDGSDRYSKYIFEPKR